MGTAFSCRSARISSWVAFRSLRFLLWQATRGRAGLEHVEHGDVVEHLACLWRRVLDGLELAAGMGHAVQGHDIVQLGLLDLLVHDVPVGLYGSPALEELRLQHLLAPASLVVEGRDHEIEYLGEGTRRARIPASRPRRPRCSPSACGASGRLPVSCSRRRAGMAMRAPAPSVSRTEGRDGWPGRAASG